MTSDQLTAIFTGMRRKLRVTAMRFTGSGSDADDALQDAFCRLWERRGSLSSIDIDGNPEGYVARTVARSAIDIVRRRRDDVMEEVGKICCVDDAAPEVDSPEEILKRISDIVDRELPSTQRDVMRLHDVEGLEIDEIAEYMSMAPGAVRVNLSRARIKTRNIYRKYYGGI